MEAPEYLDLDEIDFSDDSAYSVTSLKSIPELSRRSDGQAEDRPAPSISWGRGGPSLCSSVKPAGLCLSEPHSKFRPVKRVSPLKHQPEDTGDSWDRSGPGAGEPVEGNKEESGADKAQSSSSSSSSSSAAAAAAAGKPKAPTAGGNNNPQALFGELEHYDLDMDEILDVPYLKSSQQQQQASSSSSTLSSTLPRAPKDKRGGVSLAHSTATLDRNRPLQPLQTLQALPSHSALPSMTHNEPLSLGSSSTSQTPYCVLSPVKWSDLRKSKSMDPDVHHLHRNTSGASYTSEHLPSGLLCSSSSMSSFSDADKLLSARVYPDSSQRSGDPPGASGLMFPHSGSSTLGRVQDSKPWPPAPVPGGVIGGARGFGGNGAPGEMDEETKKKQNIINIVREGQISLLPHLAADNLELIRDTEGNNLLHVSACAGHTDCLQHLTSLMGEDALTERNSQQLTPAGLGVKNGHLECVRWMVSETEAIAELSCTREHPSLIHYAARYGQEKVLLWLLQFMQEQGISLDEVDQNGNTAVHVAAHYGHLTCLQTLVEYGSNVTVQNQRERPSQSAERQGHTTCARYLVVVETCMSLASQVVKLTKQLNEQAAERLTLQKQLHRLTEPNKAEGTPSRSPSSQQPPVEAWTEMLLTAEGSAADGHWSVRQGPDTLVLRQLLGKEAAVEPLCPRDRLPSAGRERDVPPVASGALGASSAYSGARRRELKIARLKQIMQRSLSESDSDGYPPEEGKNNPESNTTAPRPDRPNHLPFKEEEPAANQVTKKLLPSPANCLSAAEKKLAFSLSGSQSADSVLGGGFNPSALTTTFADPQADYCNDGRTPDSSDDTGGQKAAATSPKSALKSPSSRRKTSQNLKLRVTFDEKVHKSSSNQETASVSEHGKAVHHGKEKDRTQNGTPESSSGNSTNKRPFGAFRSIMESLSGNTNHNNNNSGSGGATQTGSNVKHVHSSPVRRSEVKGSPGGAAAKGKSKTSNV